MNKWTLGAASGLAVAALWTGFASSTYAQDGSDKAAPFQVVETTIDDIHAAFRAGRLTAHQLVQAYLDRIAAYDKAGPNINSVISLNPNALAEADRLDTAYRTGRFVGPTARYPEFWSKTRLTPQAWRQRSVPWCSRTTGRRATPSRWTR